MSMPVRTTSEDALAVIDYLKTKPSNVSLDTAKAAIDSSLLDYRKIAAYKYWMLLKNDTENLELSEYGREIGRKPSQQQIIFRKIIKKIPPYFTVLEWTYYQKLEELTSVDTIVHWKQHSPDEVAAEDTSASYQAACFFRFCEGASLGEMKIGRKGNPTRLVLNKDKLTELIVSGVQEISETIEEQQIETPTKDVKVEEDLQQKTESKEEIDSVLPKPVQTMVTPTTHSDELYKRVYITHGKNVNFVETLKRLLAFGELEAVVSVQTQSVSKPVPEKIMDEMRSCGAAIIHVDDEQTLFDSDGNQTVVLNGNVLIEIGAAMALYGKRFVLLVKKGVKLPSNLQGLYEVRYSGDKLDGDKTIELLEAIDKLKQEKIPD